MRNAEAIFDGGEIASAVSTDTEAMNGPNVSQSVLFRSLILLSSVISHAVCVLVKQFVTTRYSSLRVAPISHSREEIEKDINKGKTPNVSLSDFNKTLVGL